MPGEISRNADLSAPLKKGNPLANKITLSDTIERLNLLSELPAGDQQLEEVEILSRYQEVCSFLLHGPAYRWLIENAQSSALLTNRKGTVLETISHAMAEMLSMKNPDSLQYQIFQVNFDMDWDVVTFLRSQEYGTTLEIAIERAITVTGSASNVQALSCIDYMCQTWPSSGREMIRALQRALKSPDLSTPSKQKIQTYYTRPKHSRLPF